MRDDYYYSGQYAEEQAEAKSQAVESVHRTGPWHVSEHTDQAWADDLEKAIALAGRQEKGQP